MATPLLSNKNHDAHAAMRDLIKGRSLSLREEDEAFPEALAALAWRIADAMAAERRKRDDGIKPQGGQQ